MIWNDRVSDSAGVRPKWGRVALLLTAGFVASSACGEDFSNLTSLEVKEVVRNAMLARIQSIANIEYEARILRVFANYEDAANNDKISLDSVKASQWPEWTLTRSTQKRLNGSYLSSIYFDGGTGDSQPNQLYCKNWYDASEGINKGYAPSEDEGRGGGRIAGKEDPAEIQNVVNCLFDRESTNHHKSLYACIGELVDSDETVVVSSEGRIELSKKSEKVGQSGKTALYTTSVVFSVEDEIVPLSMIAKLEVPWRGVVVKDAIFMDEMSPLSGLSVPRHAKVIKDVQVEGQNTPADVYDIVLNYSGLGHLSMADLSFEYPAGTIVVDSLIQGAYVVEPNGQRKMLATPIGFGPPSDASALGSSQAGGNFLSSKLSRFVVLNAIAIGLFCIASLLIRWFRRLPGEDA